MAEYKVKNVLIATTPRILTTQTGNRIGSFRVAENLRNGETNWFTVTVSGAVSSAFEEAGFGKGSRVDIVGNLRIRDWDNGERAGTSVEIDAKSISVPAPSTHGCNCPTCTI